MHKTSTSDFELPEVIVQNVSAPPRCCRKTGYFQRPVLAPVPLSFTGHWACMGKPWISSHPEHWLRYFGIKPCGKYCLLRRWLIYFPNRGVSHSGDFKRTSILLDDHNGLIPLPKRSPTSCLKWFVFTKQALSAFHLGWWRDPGAASHKSSPWPAKDTRRDQGEEDEATATFLFLPPLPPPKSTSKSVVTRDRDDSLTATHAYKQTYVHRCINIYGYCRNQPCHQHPSLNKDMTGFAMSSKSTVKHFAAHTATPVSQHLWSRNKASGGSIDSEWRSLRACGRVRSRTPIWQFCWHFNHTSISFRSATA